MTPGGLYTFSAADFTGGYSFETSTSGNVFVVPSGVTSIGSVEAIGAGAGGGFAGPAGGGGAYAKIGSISVTPGQTLYFSAGSGSTGSLNTNVGTSWGEDSWLSNGIGGATVALVQSATANGGSPTVASFTATPSVGNTLIFLGYNTGGLASFAPPSGLTERAFIQLNGPQALYVYQRMVQSGDGKNWSFSHSNFACALRLRVFQCRLRRGQIRRCSRHR